MEFTQRETVNNMAQSLLGEGKRVGVCLCGLTEKNLNGFLDDGFRDGGKVRCEDFVDLADPYALRFGPLESKGWESARWECIRKAIERVSRNCLIHREELDHGTKS